MITRHYRPRIENDPLTFEQAGAWWLRHYLMGHFDPTPWHKLTPTQQQPWLDKFQQFCTDMTAWGHPIGQSRKTIS